MSGKNSDDKYSDEEAERRLVAALRGSRITGHKPMKDKPKKATKARKKKPKERTKIT
jgi:hypothetical protein